MVRVSWGEVKVVRVSLGEVKVVRVGRIQARHVGQGRACSLGASKGCRLFEPLADYRLPRDHLREEVLILVIM